MGDMPDLEKLRRFALLVAVVLFGYSIAGIRFKEEAVISPFGVPFEVERFDLLPVGLAVATAYGMLRYFYYAHLRTDSPRQARKAVFSLGFWETKAEYRFEDRAIAQEFAASASNLFPRFLGRTCEAAVVPGGSTWAVRAEETYEGVETWRVDFKVPRRCKIGAWLQDLDYSLPALAGLIALAFYSRVVLRQWLA